MKSLKAIVAPISILIVWTCLVIVLIVLNDVLSLSNDIGKILTITISMIGLGVGIFQFWINQINIDRRKLYQIRYDNLKEIMEVLHFLNEIFRTYITLDDCSSKPFEVSTKLGIEIDRLSLIIKTMDGYLFPNLRKKEGTKVLSQILKKMVNRTIQMENGINKPYPRLIKMVEDFRESPDGPDEPNLRDLERLELTEWIFDMREIIKDFNMKKYDFLNEIRRYL